MTKYKLWELSSSLEYHNRVSSQLPSILTSTKEYRKCVRRAALKRLCPREPPIIIRLSYTRYAYSPWLIPPNVRQPLDTLSLLSLSLMSGNPSKNYLFTIQYSGDPPMTPSSDAVLSKASYMVYQSEMAPTTGQLHLQGFIHLLSPCRLGGAKEVVCSLFSVSSAHITKGDGKAYAMAEYCQKEDTRVPGTSPTIFGVLPNPPGKNNVGETLVKMYSDYKSGKSVEDLVTDSTTASLAMRHGKMF